MGSLPAVTGCPAVICGLTIGSLLSQGVLVRDHLGPALRRCGAGENFMFVSLSNTPDGGSRVLGTTAGCVPGTVMHSIVTPLFDQPQSIALRLSVLPFDTTGKFIRTAPSRPGEPARVATVVREIVY